MSYIIGIDIGGSRTKIVGLKDGNIASAFDVKAGDALTSIYGAFGKYLSENHLKWSDISKVVCTGVGSAVAASVSGAGVSSASGRAASTIGEAVGLEVWK